jgi:hypothetical protein
MILIGIFLLDLQRNDYAKFLLASDKIEMNKQDMRESGRNG